MTKWFLEEVVLKNFEDWYDDQCGIWSKKGLYIDEKADIEDVRTFLEENPSINLVKIHADEKLVNELYEAYSKKYDEEHM